MFPHAIFVVAFFHEIFKYICINKKKKQTIAQMKSLKYY